MPNWEKRLGVPGWALFFALNAGSDSKSTNMQMFVDISNLIANFNRFDTGYAVISFLSFTLYLLLLGIAQKRPWIVQIVWEFYHFPQHLAHDIMHLASGNAEFD